MSNPGGVSNGTTGRLLLEWMRLLGWHIELEDEGLEGVAEHLTEHGERLVVRARATEQADLAGLLFERALAALEASRVRAQLGAAAA